MKYILMVYQSAQEFDARTGKDQAAFWGAWKAYAEALTAAGVMAGGSGLEPPSSSKTVRFGRGRQGVQDGPYADTKEQLGGFFILEVPDLNTALDWASRCPVKQGAVEVRAALSGRLADSDDKPPG
jgi:hypothetical protein